MIVEVMFAMKAKDYKVPMTLSLPEEDKKALKLLAVQLDTTASDLVSRWLHEELENRGVSGGALG